MAMTKAEAAKLTNDLLLRGVVETIVKESSVLQLLPFMEVTGVAVQPRYSNLPSRPPTPGNPRILESVLRLAERMLPSRTSVRSTSTCRPQSR